MRGKSRKTISFVMMLGFMCWVGTSSVSANNCITVPITVTDDWSSGWVTVEYLPCCDVNNDPNCSLQKAGMGHGESQNFQATEGYEFSVFDWGDPWGKSYINEPLSDKGWGGITCAPCTGGNEMCDNWQRDCTWNGSNTTNISKGIKKHKVKTKH